MQLVLFDEVAEHVSNAWGWMTSKRFSIRSGHVKKMKLSHLAVTAAFTLQQLTIVRVTGKDVVGDRNRSNRRRSLTSKVGNSNYNIRGVKITTEQWDSKVEERRLPFVELSDQPSDQPSDLPSTQPSSKRSEAEMAADAIIKRVRSEVSVEGEYWHGHKVRGHGGHSSKKSSSGKQSDFFFIPLPIPIPLYIPDQTDIDDVFCPLGVNPQFQCCLTWDPEVCRCPFGTPLDGMEICCEPLAGGCGCRYGIDTDGQCCLPSEECYCPFGENEQDECCESWDPEMCRCPFGTPNNEESEECCEADTEGCIYQPTHSPTVTPGPTASPQPTGEPSPLPSKQPSRFPSLLPSFHPSSTPSESPSTTPSTDPSLRPSTMPSGIPSSEPSKSPSERPSIQPSLSILPSASPSEMPSLSSLPSLQPSERPSHQPSSSPSQRPSERPSISSAPSLSALPSFQPSVSVAPSSSSEPSTVPSISNAPSMSPHDRIPLDCEEAMVYCGMDANPDRMEWCNNFQNKLPNRWGFTNRVGTNETCVIGVAKSWCDVTKGYDAGSVEIDQENKKFTVNLNPGVLILEYHITTTVGFQSVTGNFERYPKNGGIVEDGDRIFLDPASPFDDDDWFTFQGEVCRDRPSIRNRTRNEP